MIIIGDEHIPYETIEKISCVEDIKNTQPNATVIFDFDIEILKYTQANDIKSAVKVNNIKDLIYSAELNAYYIIPTNDILEQAQSTADNYMFDSRILAVIESSDEVEALAIKEIDGVVFKSLI